MDTKYIQIKYKYSHYVQWVLGGLNLNSSSMKRRERMGMGLLNDKTETMDRKYANPQSVGPKSENQGV